MKKFEKKWKKINAEKGNIWSFISLIIEVFAATIIVRAAYFQSDDLIKIALAIIGAVLVINLLAKLYTLIRK